MTTFAIATLGCKVNTFESCGYQNALLKKGYEEVDFKDVADIYIINTCAVTNIAASKSRTKIHQAKAKNPNALICVVGCYAQVGYDYLMEHEQIDVLVGSEGKNQFVDLIEEALKGNKVKTTLHDVRASSVFEALPLNHFEHQTRAFLKIQDGCNQFCSYCIIPYARGKERSMDEYEAIKVANTLCEHGHKEIVLTGIHTGRYGNGNNTSLTKLLQRMINEVKGLERIRISSIELNEITDDFLTLMKNNDKIAKHLHIPLQAGCDSTLKNMNRPYDMEYFKKRVKAIKEYIPNISISTDIIVGFPMESEEDFMISKQNIEEIAFTFLHVFPYSAKQGTKAAKMKGQLTNVEKKKRVSALVETSKRLYTNYKETFIGKEVDVLFEKVKDGMLIGHSSEYLEVMADLDPKYLNQIVKVTIERLNDDILIGR